jgi:predicted DNA-binding transcriptional regulator AlpA
MLGKLINEHHLAAELGLSVWALRKWKQRGYGPQPKKLGKRVMYVRSDVEAFLSKVGGEG